MLSSTNKKILAVLLQAVKNSSSSKNVGLTVKAGRFFQPAYRLISTSPTNMQQSADKKLFTPGPLGVSMKTKQAMLRDLGSRDSVFIALVKNIRNKIVELADVSGQEYTCVPVQGSGTYSIEAVLTSTVPRTGKVLILENGAYGKRQGKICQVLNIPYHQESFPENEKVSVLRVEEILKEDPNITNVAVVHCETSSGVVNPVKEIGKLINQMSSNITYFVDAMSSFGAIPINVKECHIDYLVSSANKCIEGVPGFSFAICRTEHLLSCKGFSRSYSLDLVDQYDNLENTGQFRFTPPTHTMLAFQQALNELDEEGGVEGRGKRYSENREILRKGMSKMGFQEFLDSSHDGYIITSYCFPSEPNFYFSEFYQRLSDKGQVIYPGKVLNADCFRIGNIGHLYPEDMTNLLKCVDEVCTEMGIKLPMIG